MRNTNIGNISLSGLIVLSTLAFQAACLAQSNDAARYRDYPSTQVGRGRLVDETHGTLGHPYHIEARHADGTVFYNYDGLNLRTSAGTTWQSQLMGDTSTPAVNAQCNYLALTNTAVTPAEADTTLSGEIATNGLSRAQATYTDASTTLAVPGAATLVVTGGGGGTAQYYYVFAQNQGIYTTVGATSASATPNATLSATAYITGTFTGVAGASNYAIIRSNSNTPPSGSLSGGSTQSSTGLISGIASCVAGVATTCTFVDNSNTLTAFTVPGSNLTNFGKYTLVHTWTATGAQSAQAFGVLTAASLGTMCFEGTFTQVALNTNDTLQLTESVYF